MYSSHVDVHLL